MISAEVTGKLCRNAEVIDVEWKKGSGREGGAAVPAQGETRGPERGRVGAEARDRRTVAARLAGQPRAAGDEGRAATARAEGGIGQGRTGRARPRGARGSGSGDSSVRARGRRGSAGVRRRRLGGDAAS